MLGLEMIKLLKNTLKFNIYNDYPIIAAFSTKNGGVSEGCYQSLNLTFSTGDKKEAVIANYKKFADQIGIDFNQMVLSSQKHNDNILIASSQHAGMGLSKNKSYDDIDGIYTEELGLPIITGHADCTPIFFYDKKRHAIGVVHSGWRGTAKEIAKKMVELFMLKGSDPKDILCVIGPAICYDCYEVGDEVIQAMPAYCHLEHTEANNCHLERNVANTCHLERNVVQSRDLTNYNKPHIDLKDINCQILIHAGILTEHIEVSKYCTKCDAGLFFSHRLSGSKRGGMIACMTLL